MKLLTLICWRKLRRNSNSWYEVYLKESSTLKVKVVFESLARFFVTQNKQELTYSMFLCVITKEISSFVLRFLSIVDKLCQKACQNGRLTFDDQQIQILFNLLLPTSLWKGCIVSIDYNNRSERLSLRKLEKENVTLEFSVKELKERWIYFRVKWLK